MTELQIIKKIKCGDNPKNWLICADSIRDKLETALKCKLMANNFNDVVNGSITIIHEDNKHIIKIIFYDKNENPNKYHDTTFKKIESIPSLDKIEKILMD